MLKKINPTDFHRRFIAVALTALADQHDVVKRPGLQQLARDWPDEHRPGRKRAARDPGSSLYDFIRKNTLSGIEIRRTRRGSYDLGVARPSIRPQDWDFAYRQFHKLVPGYEINARELDLRQRDWEVNEAFALGAFDLERAREMRQRMFAIRPEQAYFKGQLELIYHRCPITQCDSKDSLEAAHVLPENGPNTSKAWNGLLLRADIHRLWDALLIAIEAETGRLLLADELRGTTYDRDLAGKCAASGCPRPHWTAPACTQRAPKTGQAVGCAISLEQLVVSACRPGSSLLFWTSRPMRKQNGETAGNKLKSKQ